MTVSYRVVDLRPAIVDVVGIVVEGAKSPEQAAEIALGQTLVRSGAPRDLAARVYWQNPGEPLSMVRLYTLISR